MLRVTDIHKIISYEFATELTKLMGYSFLPDRIQRIADEARYAVEHGIPAAWAYAHAVDLEILMYGDPNYRGPEPIGILRTKEGLT